MNVQNVKQKLDKVNSFYSYLIENQDIVARVDKDAFIASIRALYEACFEEETAPQPVAETQKTVAPPTEEQDTPTTKKRPKLVFNHQNASKNTNPAKEQPAAKEKPAPKKEETPQPQPKEEKVEQAISKPTEQPKAEEKPVVKEEVKAPETSPKTEPVDPLQLVKEQHEALNEEGFQEEYEPLFRFKEATDLSQKLSSSRLDDLQKALGLNEKFLYINELFGGDVGQFQQAIKTLNEGENFDEARRYIEQQLIAQNDWMNKAKRPVAKDFIKLVRRRYV